MELPGYPSTIVTLWTIRPGDSRVNRKAMAFQYIFHNEAPKSPTVWARLEVNPLSVPRTPHRMIEGHHMYTPFIPRL